MNSVVKSGVFLEFEGFDDRFIDYGLRSAPLTYKGRKIPYKAILKRIGDKDEVVAILGRNYTIVPNAMVLEAARQIARRYNVAVDDQYLREAVEKMLEIKPKDLREFRKKYWPMVVEKLKSSQLTVDWDGFYGSRIYISMIIPEPIKWGDETLFPGVQIRNSEDGTMGFGVDAMTFRVLCANGVIVPGRKLPVKAFFKHTKQLEGADLRKILEIIDKVLDYSRAIIEGYEYLRMVETADEIVEELGKRLPKRYLPEYIKVEKQQAKLISTEPPTLWDLYNDITRLIWHSAETNMMSKRYLYDQLHKVITVPGMRR